MCSIDSSTDDEEIITLLKGKRRYAGAFDWPERDIAELGIVKCHLSDALRSTGELWFHEVTLRGRGSDPPDCEAVNNSGERVAIEVTELVSGEAIQLNKQGKLNSLVEWKLWEQDEFSKRLNSALQVKDKRFPALKDPPYSGGYVIVIHTDEQGLSTEVLNNFLANHRYERLENVTCAYLLSGNLKDARTHVHFTLKIGEA